MILYYIRVANPTVKFYQGSCMTIDLERKEIDVQPEKTKVNIYIYI